MSVIFGIWWGFAIRRILRHRRDGYIWRLWAAEDDAMIRALFTLVAFWGDVVLICYLRGL